MTEKSAAAMTEETVSVEVKLSPIVAELLAVLDRDVAHLPRPPAPEPPKLSLPASVEEMLAMSDDEQEALRLQLEQAHRLDHAPRAETLEQRCARVLLQLADHAQQGVYQNGGWERQWIVQAFGDGWLQRTEPGDPYDRTNDQLDVELSQRLYRRPKRV
jgi:hypothetical protein